MYSNILEFQMIKLFLDKYKNTYMQINKVDNIKKKKTSC